MSPEYKKAIVDLIESEEAKPEDFASTPLPKTIRAAVIRRGEEEMFHGLESRDKDPRKSLHLEEVELPPLGPGEVLVGTMASAINFNTVWTAIFEPVPTFRFLERFAKLGDLDARHNLDYHIVGSDGSGVVLRIGPGVTHWRPGDRVTIHCNYVDLQDPAGHGDAMHDPYQRIWGFETNFGGLAEISLVRANQLMPKPEHLTWEEAASPGLVNCTAYRMLVGKNGAQMKQGDNVLVWGAAGGLGGFAVQYVLNGGGFPIGVVSSPEKAELVRSLGCEAIIDRRAEGYAFLDEGGHPNPKEIRRFGKRIREYTGGEDPDIVYEHPGRATFAASVFVARRGGRIVTCASTSGYEHVYDNRYLWMNVKSIIGSHFANYREAFEANRLVCKGRIHPILSESFPLDDVGEAAYRVHRNMHAGKLGVLCLAPGEGLGIRNRELREKIGEEILSRFCHK